MFEKYFMVALYFSALLLLGYLASRRVTTMKDFVVGGKSLGFWVAAFSAQATGESAWLLLGLTGMGAMIGFSAYWVVIGELLGVAAMWFLMAGRFKRLSDRYDAITVIDYMVGRFRSRSHLLRVLSAVTLTLFVLIYIAAQIDATGSAFETFLDWNYLTGAIVGFVIVTTYCIAGGFLAAAWTDMLQGAVMLVCLMLLPIVAWLSLTNTGAIHAGLAAIDPGLTNVWGPGGFSLLNVAAVIGMALIGLGFLGSPQVFARLIAIRNEAQIHRGKWVAVLFTLLADFSAVSIGILGRYIFTSEGIPPDSVLGNGAQNVLPELVSYTFPPWLVGLYVAAVLSAIMSTVSSLIVMAAGSITHDLYERFIRPQAGPRELLLVGQATTVLLLVLGVMTALVSNSIGAVFRLVIAIGSGPGVVLVLRWFWWRVNAAAELSAMLCGFLVGVLTSITPLVRIDDYGLRLAVITGVSAAVWLSVMLCTPPESEAVLERFVRKVRPPGPGWAHLRRRFEVTPIESFPAMLQRFVWACGVLFGGLLGTGGFLLHQHVTGWCGLSVLVVSFLMLRRPALAVQPSAE